MSMTTTETEQERKGAEDTASGSANAGGMYLTFYLGSEEYGLEILKVQEIIGMMPVTPVPRTPDFMRGVINLRGKVIPTIDLRIKFGMPPVEDTDQTCIIVVHTVGAQIGVVVDRVSEVVDIPEGDVEPAPDFGADVNTDYLLGIGRTDSRVRLLVDIVRVLSGSDVMGVQNVEPRDA